MAGCLYLLCALIRLAYFNVLEEERQQGETEKRQWYLGLPVTSSALILPAFYAMENGRGPAAGGMVITISMLLAAAFVLPIKIKKPYLFGKIGLVTAGLIEFIVLLMGLGMEV